MAIVDKKSGSAMTSAISQLVYMPNSGQSDNPPGRKTVTDRNTETQKHRNTDLNFIKIDILSINVQQQLANKE